jgi:hypothetical protein
LPSVPLIFHSWFLAAYPEMMLDGFPFKDMLLNVFDGLDRKPEPEQRHVGRELLHDYLLSRAEKMPIGR